MTMFMCASRKRGRFSGWGEISERWTVRCQYLCKTTHSDQQPLTLFSMSRDSSARILWHCGRDLTGETLGSLGREEAQGNLLAPGEESGESSPLGQ